MILIASAVPALAQEDEIDFMPGRLSVAHEGLEDPDSCDNCHDDDFNIDGGRCLVCHDQIAGRVEARKGVHREVTIADCAVCHVEHQGRDGDLRPIDPTDFDHAEETGFAIEGYHGEFAGDCSNCHTTRSFLNLTPDCTTCHEDVHKSTLGDDCTACHTMDTHFRNASRAFHKSTLLPLEGRHLDVPCASCHWNGQTKGTPTNCYDCHWIRRQDDPYRTNLGVECEDCHEPIGWIPAKWSHEANTGFPIGGQHQTVDCVGCHPDRRFDGPVTPDCYSCHREDYESAREPDHVAAGFPTQCDVCHRPNDISWNQAVFNHDYKLRGQHATVECAACHGNGIYAGTPRTCVGCHLADYETSTNPDHGAAGFPTTCNLCHRGGDSSWQDADFNHAFPLNGVHATLDCSSCHGNGVYAGTPTDCVGCHLDDYEATDDPDHGGAGFPTDCEQCHQPTSWDDDSGGGFVHPYQLVGIHATVDCSACHSSGVYAGLPSDCVDCHLDNYNNTADPNHSAAGFSTACDTCHQPSDPNWFQATYPHTVWPLVGSHTAQQCSSCHTGSVYAGLPSECVDCHLDDYNATTDPDHASAGFPTDCETCHQPTTWTGATFDHPYSLVGVHATVDCSACHSSGVYAGLPSDCVDCHLDNYNNTADPNHAAAGFSTACDTCHQPSDPNWFQATYPHTVWPLVGSHTAQQCSSCHTGSVYAGLPSECVDCHLDDYNATSDPDHASAGFPTDCETCHQPTTWTGATFDHPYSLVGVHATVDCSACHSSGVYAGLPSDCVDCHLDNYNATANPNHSAAGFSTTCETCHQPSDPNWFQATYPHTVWPLVGSHTAQQCSSCHTGSVYAGLPSECVDCHLDDYNAATDPDHASAGFPTTCETCHQPTTWTGATFDHPYSLVGVHATLDCSACHSSGVYAGLPSDCVDCHLDNYNATANPNHSAAGFSTTCETCHQPSDPNWFQATYPHTVWPLVGSHTAQQCSSCHTGSVYAGLPSDCVDCHLDDYNATTDPDHDSAGFPTDCETCHQPTTWTGATFDHPYSLLGAHATLDCSACHSSGVYAGLPSDCVDCHLDNYNATANPNHTGAGFPTDCELCHRRSDANWFQGDFDHTYFPITSGKHAGTQCIDCHTDPANYRIFSCLDSGCHPRDKMDDKHDGKPGYLYDSVVCYSCHPDGKKPPDARYRLGPGRG